MNSLEVAPSGRFWPRSFVFGRAASWGIGLRCDARIPFTGPLRLIHWIVSPYGDTPAGGIVEDCVSARLPTVFGAEAVAADIHPLGPLDPVLALRRDAGNLITTTSLLGVRCWDVPHDRQHVLIDLSTGAAEIGGALASEGWCPAWRIDLRVAGADCSLEVHGIGLDG